MEYFNALNPIFDSNADYLGNWLFEHSGTFADAFAARESRELLSTVILLTQILYNEGTGEDAPKHLMGEDTSVNDYDLGTRQMPVLQLHRSLKAELDRQLVAGGGTVIKSTIELLFAKALVVMKETQMAEVKGITITLLQNGMVFGKPAEPLAFPSEWDCQ